MTTPSSGRCVERPWTAGLSSTDRDRSTWRARASFSIWLARRLPDAGTRLQRGRAPRRAAHLRNPSLAGARRDTAHDRAVGDVGQQRGDQGSVAVVAKEEAGRLEQGVAV